MYVTFDRILLVAGDARARGTFSANLSPDCTGSSVMLWFAVRVKSNLKTGQGPAELPLTELSPAPYEDREACRHYKLPY